MWNQFIPNYSVYPRRGDWVRTQELRDYARTKIKDYHPHAFFFSSRDAHSYQILFTLSQDFLFILMKEKMGYSILQFIFNSLAHHWANWNLAGNWTAELLRWAEVAYGTDFLEDGKRKRKKGNSKHWKVISKNTQAHSIPWLFQGCWLTVKFPILKIYLLLI